MTQVQLITYPDSLGGNLKELHSCLCGPMKGLFLGGVHILPPFPSSGDRGFAPIDYEQIDSSFGTWEDMQTLSQQAPLMLDLMVNHVSQKSSYFLDYQQNGKDSAYADLFLPLEKFWKNAQPPQADLEKIFLRRAQPYSTYQIQGKAQRLWTSFGKTNPSEQVDIDVFSKSAQHIFEHIFAFFAQQGVQYVRLDAVGYVAKKPGTSCFFVQPQVNCFLKQIAKLAKKNKIMVLPELHAPFSQQCQLTETGLWTYDFILPLLVFEALTQHNAAELSAYLAVRSHKQFTTLDCHDGIPVKPDLDETMSTETAQNLTEICCARGANLSYILSKEEQKKTDFLVHQIRTTYYDALGRQDDAMIAARAIQLFVPGIPQIYYVGLLAGENDSKRAASTGDGREINRHNFTVQEIEEAMEKPVVKRLKRLILLRNSHPAFAGSWRQNTQNPQQIALCWQHETHRCALTVSLDNMQSTVQFTEENKLVTIKL